MDTSNRNNCSPITDECLISCEEGSSLVELLVTMSLLLMVIFPAVFFMGYSSKNSLNKSKITASGIAQSAMEEVLQKNRWEDDVITTSSGTDWSITTEVKNESGLVLLRVRVSRSDEIISEFTTVRLSDGWQNTETDL